MWPLVCMENSARPPCTSACHCLLSHWVNGWRIDRGWRAGLSDQRLASLFVFARIFAMESAFFRVCVLLSLSCSFIHSCPLTYMLTDCQVVVSVMEHVVKMNEALAKFHYI